MRCLTNRPKTKGYFEPFSYSFYCGPDRVTYEHYEEFKDLYDVWPSDNELTIENILNRIEKDRQAGFDVVVKDFGWFIYKHMDKLPQDAKHVFLVRDPVLLGFSTLNILMNSTNENKSQRFLDFVHKVYGMNGLIYSSLLDMYKHFHSKGQRVILLDTREFTSEPLEAIKSICEFTDVEFSEDMLTWKPMKEYVYPDNWVYPEALVTFDRIFNWLGMALNSSGLEPAPEHEVGDMPWQLVPPQMLQMLQIQQKYYDAIKTLASETETNDTARGA
jgi:hypothetical protein